MQSLHYTDYTIALNKIDKKLR